MLREIMKDKVNIIDNFYWAVIADLYLTPSNRERLKKVREKMKQAHEANDDRSLNLD